MKLTIHDNVPPEQWARVVEAARSAVRDGWPVGVGQRNCAVISERWGCGRLVLPKIIIWKTSTGAYGVKLALR